MTERGSVCVELVEVSLERGVDLQACGMTMDLMGYDDDFFDGVTTGVGAAPRSRGWPMRTSS